VEKVKKSNAKIVKPLNQSNGSTLDQLISQAKSPKEEPSPPLPNATKSNPKETESEIHHRLERLKRKVAYKR